MAKPSIRTDDEADFLRPLGKKLLELDQRRRCSFKDPRSNRIKCNINTIIESIVERLPDFDLRFRGKQIPMGSSHENLKVGQPDEFDFMVEITDLSETCLVYMRSEVGFADVKFEKGPRQRWVMVDHYMKEYGRQRVIDPRALQEEFRKAIDGVMKVITLPEHWRHGGNSRPDFSGHRKHGPATLYQFEYTGEKETLQVNLDITLAIKVDKSVGLDTFQLQRLEQFPDSNSCAEKLRRLLDEEPGIYIIPLYSKEMVVKGRFDKKYSWRASCSLAERCLLDEFPEDSFVKTLIRVSKILRADYLMVPEHEKKRKDSDGEQPLDQQPANGRADPSHIREMTRERLQDGEVSFVESKEGENWGPSYYVTSFEIKTKVLEMLFNSVWTEERARRPAEAEDLARYTALVFLYFHKIFSTESGSVTSLYVVDKPVCSPLSAEERQQAVNGLDRLFREFLRDDLGSEE